MQLIDGENIVYVTSQLESALTIDRPISWADHRTAVPGQRETVVDMPGSQTSRSNVTPAIR